MPDNANVNEPVYKPRRFTPTGDGSLFLTSVKWSRYGGAVAPATARAHATDCSPSCGDGTFHTATAAIWLSQPKRLCGTRMYRRIRLKFRHVVPPDRSRDSTWLVAISGCEDPPPAPNPGAAQCPAFSYDLQSAGLSYRFSSLEISGAPCTTIEDVVRGYFEGKGQPAGSAPTDGYVVFGWNVLIVARHIDGKQLDGGAYFDGVYD